MPTIKFRGKLETIYNPDNTPAYQRLKVPAIERRHCDMAAFRKHPKFGAYANSDLFHGMIKHSLKNAGVGAFLRLDRLPECVAVDASGFLAEATITID